jgi:3-oxoadipate enol-lactonase
MTARRAGASAARRFLHDTGTPPAATTQAIAEEDPDARFEVLDAAHLAPIEQSQRFAAQLETFLETRV